MKDKPECNTLEGVSIEDSCELYRRIPPYHIIEDCKAESGYRPSSAAFDNDSHGDPMSIELEDTLQANGLIPETVLDGHEGFGLVSFTAEFARSKDQEIGRDPLPDSPAHGLVIGDKTKSTRRTFYKNSTWVILPEQPVE